MSKTKKGSKSLGYDYNGKRGGKKGQGHCQGFGPKVKKITHKIERAASKQGLLKEPTEPEYDPREYIPEAAEAEMAAEDAEREMGLNRPWKE